MIASQNYECCLPWQHENKSYVRIMRRGSGGPDSTGRLLCLPVLKQCSPPVPLCPNIMFYLLLYTEGTFNVFITWLSPLNGKFQDPEDLICHFHCCFLRVQSRAPCSICSIKTLEWIDKYNPNRGKGHEHVTN